MAAREFLFAVIESSYGTAKSTPTLGTDSQYIRLDGGNAFTAEAEPIQQSISYGGGYAVEADTVSDVVSVKGSLTTYLYPVIASYYTHNLLKWAFNPVNSGRTTPWTTTDSGGVMPVGDMASMSFYHAYLTEDGTTYKRTRYAGCKCDSLTLSASENDRLWRLTCNFTGIRPVGNAWDSSSDPDATEFPAPADAAYPVSPFTFGHLASGTGVVTVGSSSGTNRAASCSAVSFRLQNRFSPAYYTSRFLTIYRWVGRSAQMDCALRYKSSPADRDSWRALAAQTAKLIIDNSSSAVQIDMKGNNLLRPWRRDLPMDREYMQTLSFANRYSVSATTDLALTVS